MNIVLKTPDRDYTLPLTLSLVETLEAEGSLLQLAEQLAARQVKLCEVMRQLLRLYTLAGCDMPEAALEEYLLNNAPVGQLADILVQILTPLRELGAAAGKPSASP